MGARWDLSNRIAKEVLHDRDLQTKGNRSGVAPWDSVGTVSTILRSDCGHATDEHQSTMAKLNYAPVDVSQKL